MIMGIIIVRGNEDGHSCLFRRCEQAVDVLDGAVGVDILSNDTPCHAIRAEEIILRVGDQKGGSALNEFEPGIGQSTVISTGAAADDRCCKHGCTCQCHDALTDLVSGERI